MNIDQFNKLYANFKPVEVSEKVIKKVKKMLIKSPFEGDKIKNLLAKVKTATITKREAINDVSDFFKAIKYCYSGYEYFSSIVDFSNLEKNIIKIINSNEDEKITSIDLGQLLYDNLKIYIKDGHFSFIGFGNANFNNHWQAFVTGVVVKEHEDGYKVIKGVKQLPAGTILNKKDVKEKLLPTLTIGYTSNTFLIGIYTKDEPKHLNIGKIKLKTHLIKSDNYELENCNYIHKYEENNNYNVFLSRSYNILKNKSEILQEYYDFGVKSKNKEIVIFDLCNNHGGDSNFPKSFIEGLNDYAYWQIGCASIINPIFNTKAIKKSYKIEALPKSYNYDLAKYKGTLYVLTNKKTASSGESAVSYARSCKRVVFVGSATAGVGEFGDIKVYRLLNSNLVFYFGYKIFYMQNYQEGKGFLPNYWLDTKDPLNYLVKYLKNKELI